MNKLLIGIILALISTQSPAYWYARVGAGQNTTLFSDVEWEGDDYIGCGAGIGYRHNIRGRWHGDLSYTHYSQCMTGHPFDDEYEDSLDAFYYFIEYRWE